MNEEELINTYNQKKYDEALKEVEDKEEVEMIYRDNDIRYLEKELDKYKTTIDKIKEYCKNTINRYEDYIGKEDIVRENKFILELLEEIE